MNIYELLKEFSISLMQYYSALHLPAAITFPIVIAVACFIFGYIVGSKVTNAKNRRETKVLIKNAIMNHVPGGIDHAIFSEIE